MPDWTETEIAYFAGIVDGEGSLSISGHHGRGKLSVVNTSPHLMQWIQRRFGGTLHLNEGLTAYGRTRNYACKRYWSWQVSAMMVVPLLQRLMPYLIIKKRQAEVLIAFRATVAPLGGRHLIESTVREERQRLKAEMHLLNGRLKTSEAVLSDTVL